MTDTLAGYDDIPYASFPIGETHPDRLAVIGQLFGLQPPPPAQARVLEFGCASGGNLIPIAWHLPDTRCLGLELSKIQAQQGADRIRELGIANIEIRHLDILDYPTDGEPFDYIIAHGVFSWVPTPVQEHILALCAARLAPGGIAYISYNTLPGGRQRAMLRDMLLHHVRDRETPRLRLSAARELLEFLATPTEPSPPGQDWLRQEIAYLRGARDSYLYHEYLEDRNEALLFSDFVSRAGRHGLQFLAESRLHMLFSSTLGPQAEAALAGFDDLVKEEQYADFLRLRQFRQTLLCRSDEPLTREIDLDSLFALPMYANLTPDPGRTGRFRDLQGQEFDVPTPLAQGIVQAAAELFPEAGTLDEIISRADRSAGLPTPPDRAALGPLKEALFNLFVSGGLHHTLCPPSAPLRLAVSPLALPACDPLVRLLATQGESLLPTPRHETLALDTISQRMVALLDGHHSPEAVAASIERDGAKDPVLSRALGGGNRERRMRRLQEHLGRVLALLNRQGLIRHVDSPEQ